MNGARLLLRGGTVISLDPEVGDFERADVLIQGGRIAQIGRDLPVDDAEVIDASSRIVMPGFIDTHRHMWEGLLRNLFPDLSLTEYYGYILEGIGPSYRPEDALVGTLLSAYGAIDAGITTILDFSHIQNSPEFADACIDALRQSGMRAVFGYGFPSKGTAPWWTERGTHAYPADLQRIQRQYFTSKDQLLTLCLAPHGPGSCPDEVVREQWEIARAAGVRISVHAGSGKKRGFYEPFADVPNFFGPDATYIHCNAFSEREWQLVAESGGTVSLSAGTELPMGHGVPATQKALEHGIRPSLSVDVETTEPGDFFTTMRLTLYMQRHEVNQRRLAGQAEVPAYLSARDVLEFATIEGARACGLDGLTGSLTPGKDADLILLATDRINVMPINDPVGAVVESMDTSNVDTVIVKGRVLKRNGVLTGLDVKALEHRVVQARDHVLRGADHRTGGLAGRTA
jgi:5-methylthioadenosine/S-adenosylhomocysteine deaminase